MPEKIWQLKFRNEKTNYWSKASLACTE